MSKYLKLLSASGLATALLFTSVGTSDVAQAQTTTKVPTNTTARQLDKTKPYYYYNGYFFYSGKTVLNQQFKDAVNHDNVMIDGYMVNKKRLTQAHSAAGFYSHDNLIDKFDKNTIVAITLTPKTKSISKQTFEKAYQSFKLVRQTTSNNKTSVTNLYKTKAGTYFTAYFEKGYLVSITIQ
ncbi:hypothetical protein ERX27_08890 [Macrococcus brunensis]|uniref:Immunodominant staphylococcal antigen B n=1 Tax=Macrococcus brunensis TaxID=198483 RepID=A0A4R6BBP9_9STAP|nr:hypothetical protein [Macrococcus brunensis]TDL95260.1 hypothetical protein ERX27_08890 [Macrococcus brunensis]